MAIPINQHTFKGGYTPENYANSPLPTADGIHILFGSGPVVHNVWDEERRKYDKSKVDFVEVHLYYEGVGPVPLRILGDYKFPKIDDMSTITLINPTALVQGEKLVFVRAEGVQQA